MFSLILQVRSRSLNHLDTLELRQAVASVADAVTLKDSRSEPDCTKSLSVPSSEIDDAQQQQQTNQQQQLQHQQLQQQRVVYTGDGTSTSTRRHALSRSQVR